MSAEETLTEQLVALGVRLKWKVRAHAPFAKVGVSGVSTRSGGAIGAPLDDTAARQNAKHIVLKLRRVRGVERASDLLARASHLAEPMLLLLLDSLASIERPDELAEIERQIAPLLES